ncbi:heparin lyase I family protein [Paraburkholderia megapolitana]|uniref:heparin lyase I family protein n=1 Tax=Paraburkholderia megapolitana TaxID=420953 RepID=UPI0038BC62FE
MSMPLRRCLHRLVIVLGGLLYMAGALSQEEVANGIAGAGFQLVFETSWKNGFERGMGTQAAQPADVAVVDDPLSPGHKAVRIHIGKDENFAHVANGLPRAELLLPQSVHFETGREYLIRWSTLLPAGFRFDSQKMAIVTQIHQSALSGSPPFMLTLLGPDYTASERGGTNTVHGRGARICCASSDVARWVHWALYYTPDASGHRAITQLWKDGVKVFDSHGMPNAYPDEQRAYLKLGVYKPGWQQTPSDIDEITLFYGPVSVQQRGE